MLDILDTPNSEDMEQLRHRWIRAHHVAAIIYSVCSRSSFEHVAAIHAHKTFPICVVGNKNDEIETRGGDI
jgi:DNA-binding LacI/PurR family transcriptional regulator